MRIQIAGSLLGVALLASCGGGGASASGSDGALSEADKSRIADEWRQCMSDAGLEAEIQYDNGGMDISVGGGEDTTDEDMMAAELECEPILEDLEADGGPDLSPEEEAELADANFEVADCLAEQGYVVIPSDDGLDMNYEDQPDGFDEAEYQAAEEECFKAAVPELWAKYGPDSE